MAARMTPDQKVGSSDLSALTNIVASPIFASVTRIVFSFALGHGVLSCCVWLAKRYGVVLVPSLLSLLAGCDALGCLSHLVPLNACIQACLCVCALGVERCERVRMYIQSPCHTRTCHPRGQSPSLTAVGFEPTPFRTGA